jgi:inosose dehydratase
MRTPSASGCETSGPVRSTVVQGFLRDVEGNRTTYGKGAAIVNRFRIGHTGITWKGSTEGVKQAIKDTAELGYLSFETFGSVAERFAQEEPGGLGAVLSEYGIPLSAIYCPTAFVDPADGAADVEQVVRWAEGSLDLGISSVVLQATGRSDKPYPHYKGMGEVFNEIGRRMKELGLVTSIHPHTGTLIETGEEIDAVMNAIDPDLVGFAPDTGQIAKGGTDPVAKLRQYVHLIRHVHLKDYAGGRKTAHGGYAPIGSGVIDMASIFQLLEEANFDGWVNVELDGPPAPPMVSRDAAAMSMGYLRGLLGDRAAW